MTKLAYSLTEAGAAIGLSRSKVHALVQSGVIRAKRTAVDDDGEPAVFDDVEVIEHLGIQAGGPQDTFDYQWIAPDGTECDIGDILTSESDVMLMGTGATNPAGTAGVELQGGESEAGTCTKLLTEALVDFP